MPQAAAQGLLLDDDGMVGTDIRALSALDALIRVDPGSSVCAVQTHRVLRAHLHARVGKATLAAVCHIDPLFRTRIAGEFDHIDERRRVVCLRLIRLLDPLGYRCGSDAPRYGSPMARRSRSPTIALSKKTSFLKFPTSPGMILYGSSSIRLSTDHSVWYAILATSRKIR